MKRWRTTPKGALVRAQADLKSAKVRELGGGVVCISTQSRVVDGKERVHLVDPVDGWSHRRRLSPRRARVSRSHAFVG